MLFSLFSGTFLAAKCKHVLNMMTDQLSVGSICLVTCDTQQIPRVARITLKGQDSFSVKSSFYSIFLQIFQQENIVFFLSSQPRGKSSKLFRHSFKQKEM